MIIDIEGHPLTDEPNVTLSIYARAWPTSRGSHEDLQATVIKVVDLAEGAAEMEVTSANLYALRSPLHAAAFSVAQAHDHFKWATASTRHQPWVEQDAVTCRRTQASWFVFCRCSKSA